MSLPSEVSIDNVPSGDKCRWCPEKPHWSTTAYHQGYGWSDLCDRHLGKLLRRLRLTNLRVTLPDPVVQASAER